MNLSQTTYRHKNSHLEVVRGAAALLVISGHLIDKIPNETLPKNQITALFSNWGTEAVIIFFILSGIVIHSSFVKKPRNSGRFLLERIVRIHPTLLIAVMLAIAIEYFFLGTSQPWHVIIANTIPVTTLQGHLAPVLYQTNPVIWSLSFEIFFYFTFGSFIVYKSAISYRNILIWLLIGISSIPVLYNLTGNNIFLSYLILMLSFSPIWIVGYMIWKYHKHIHVSRLNFWISLLMLPLISRLHLTQTYYDPFKYFIFALVSIPFFIFLINYGKTSSTKQAIIIPQIIVYTVASYSLFIDNSYSLTSKLLYITLPIFSLIFNIHSVFDKVKIIYNATFKPFFSTLGNLSYSLYLVHYPIIVGVFSLQFIGPFIKIILSIFLFASISLIIERSIQPMINAIYKRKR